jgi:diguanylate cyclase
VLAVLCVGIDHRGPPARPLGPRSRDRLLADLAVRLARARRRSDTVVRCGDGVFAMVLPRVGTAESAGRVAGRVVREVRRPIWLDGVEHHLDAGVGIAMSGGAGGPGEPGTLLRDAERARRRAQAVAGGAPAHPHPRFGHQRPRWTMAERGRRARASEDDGGSSPPGSPMSTAPT